MAEREKRRATTFVTSRGAIINVAAPSVYIAPGVTPADVTSPAEMREALREELDIHDIASWIGYLNKGIDAYFLSFKRTTGNVWEGAKPSDFWTTTTFGGVPSSPFKRPSGNNVVSIRSIKSYRHGKISIYCKSPSLTDDNQALWMGFETDDCYLGGVAHFRFIRVAGVIRLYAFLGSIGIIASADITNCLPADHAVALHEYWVAVRRNVVEWGIDGKIVAVGVSSPMVGYVVVNSPPYAILLVPYRLNTAMRTIMDLEWWDAGAATTETTIDIPQWGFRVSDGDSLSPSVYRLYESGTSNLFIGKSVAAGTLISHPIPTFGYVNKTFYFRAGVTGTVAVEILTVAGNWREYYSDTVSANVLWWFKMTGDAVLARLSYTPTSYPATVSEGEMILNG